MNIYCLLCNGVVKGKVSEHYLDRHPHEYARLTDKLIVRRSKDNE